MNVGPLAGGRFTLFTTDEFTFAQTDIGVRPDELWSINRFALDVAFADDATLVPLRADFDHWAAQNGDLLA